MRWRLPMSTGGLILITNWSVNRDLGLPRAEKTTARWRRRKDDRPGEIAKAALECFAERGFAACPLDAIAARAGVTKGTLYLYFPNKEALFKEVVRQALV